MINRLDKEAFMQQYLLNDATGDRTIEDSVDYSEHAWDLIQGCTQHQRETDQEIEIRRLQALADGFQYDYQRANRKIEALNAQIPNDGHLNLIVKNDCRATVLRNTLIVAIFTRPASGHEWELCLHEPVSDDEQDKIDLMLNDLNDFKRDDLIPFKVPAQLFTFEDLPSDNMEITHVNGMSLGSFIKADDGYYYYAPVAHAGSLMTQGVIVSLGVTLTALNEEWNKIAEVDS